MLEPDLYGSRLTYVANELLLSPEKTESRGRDSGSWSVSDWSTEGEVSSLLYCGSPGA